MQDPTIDLTPFVSLIEAKEPVAPILARCLEFEPRLEPLAKRAAASGLAEEIRSIELLKMARPRAASARATILLQRRLEEATREPGPERVLAFCDALSTWGGIQRTFGQRDDAALALHHCLRILRPVPGTSVAGFALTRAAYVLADFEAMEAAHQAADHALLAHQATRDGRHNAGTAAMGSGILYLYYQRNFDRARSAFASSLHLLSADDDLMRFSAYHGMVSSYMMQNESELAASSLSILDRQFENLPPALQVLLRWLQAEVHAGRKDHEHARHLFEQLFEDTCRICEPGSAAKIGIQALRERLDAGGATPATWRNWHERLLPLQEELTSAERTCLEPLVDALAAGEVDGDLLDHVAVSLKQAVDRMALGAGRPGAAGKPELFGRLDAA